jgi:hypothetical protein
MRKKIRIIIAFILNLFPGLGLYFSGTVHDLKWLRLLGCGLTAALLMIIPSIAVMLHPTPLINYHFTASELTLPLAIALVSGTLGAGVEQSLKEQKEKITAQQ